MASPRVHEIAATLGIESTTVLEELERLGVPARGPSSAVAPALARTVRDNLTARGVGPSPRIAPQTLNDLPRSLPTIVRELGTAGDSRWQNAHQNATRERNFFYLDGEHEQRVLARGSMAAIGRDGVELPTASGVAFVGRAFIVLWSNADDRLEVASAVVGRMLGDVVRLWPVRVEYESVPVREGFFRPVVSGRSGPVARLAGVSLLVPLVDVSVVATGAGRGDAPGRPVKARVDEGVRLVSFQRRRGAVPRVEPLRAGGGAGHAARWRVRGHWRNQWHPAAQEHRRVWIAEHFAGPADAPLRPGGRVYVIRPARG